MGIKEFKQGGNTVVIDEKMIQSLTGLRNRSFHGTSERGDKVLSKYIDAVEKLMYINEKILDFVRKEEADPAHDEVWLITGKR